ncbi:hypothetical protein N5J06_10830 [Ralstonia sp. CHL-2022]|uniref:Uncharacterized protein n=1 Tax=Ralstonia mojiangensis TaxID=2953895 RepID=A0ABT2L7Q9_9RALS|nr:hypothetical protein [Ralstonia mojiangensis]MCT7298904.1 hypothetical protein [Ralstonia mojiangensis]MCT7311441.1 hypothetical protein [Ralstonia mojiangensis]
MATIPSTTSSYVELALVARPMEASVAFRQTGGSARMKKGSGRLLAMFLMGFALFITLAIQWSSYRSRRDLIEDGSISATAAQHPEMKTAFDVLAACLDRAKHGADRPPVTTRACISSVRDKATAIDRPDIVDTFNKMQREIDRKTKEFEAPFPLRLIL